MLSRRAVLTFTVAAVVAIIAGCQQSAIDANKQQLADQQAQLDQLKQQVVALQNQPATYSTAAPQPGACDAAVLSAATRKGGERMAAGDASKALGYYQDAVTACPASAEAQLNLANAYESIGDRAEAVQHYRLSADATGPGADANASQKARDALSRIGTAS
jgi:tetratricopeptide (TPR) repeat protein